MRKYWLAGAAALALVAAGYGLRAQISNIIPTQFNGYETIVAAALGPGSESEFILSGMLRNTTGGVTSAATSGTVTWPTTPLTPSGPIVPAQYSTVVYTAATGGITLTQNLPPTPFDGQVVELINGTASGNVTLTTAVTDGSTQVNGVSGASVTPGSSKQLFYLKATNTWYGMR